MAAALVASGGWKAHADSPAYFTDIGYNKLATQLGASTPTGAGVRVAQIETHEGPNTEFTNDNRYDYKPDPTLWDFLSPGKTFNVVVPPGTGGADISDHAGSTVGFNFYGNTQSVAPGISTIDVFLAGDWQDTDYLRTAQTAAPRTVAVGLSGAERIGNHAYTGSFGSFDLDALERTDFVIDKDHFIQIAGTTNGFGSTPQQQLACSYNAIVVGRRDGQHGLSTASAGGIYTAGRQGVDLVAPAGSTSAGAARVSAPAALLIQTAHSRPSLSTGSETTRDGRTIYYGETAQVVKAALMAGASRTAGFGVSSTDPYSRNSVNGLDARYGAGLVNIYNSWHILDEGEQNSQQDGGGAIRREGWDFDTAFGGASGSNSTAVYTFSRPNLTSNFAASLVWNVAIDINKVVATVNQDLVNAATLNDLNLSLFQITAGGDVLVQSSTSATENTENLWIPTLTAGNYKLVVSANGSFNTRYGLAWQLISNLDGDFNNDTLVNAADIDTLFSNLGGSVDLYDLNDDGSVNTADVDHLLGSLLHRRHGDANLDGMVDVADLSILRSNLGLTGVGWASGDFTGDARVDVADLAILRNNLGLPPPGFSVDSFLAGDSFGGAGFGGGAGLIAAPEPNMTLLLAGLISASRLRRKTN